MNYADIKQYDVANGLGIRVSLFVSGCTHHCKNCFNKETWDFRFGNPFTEAEIEKILEYLKPSYVSGLSLLGGEPFEPENQQVLVHLLKKIRETYPQKDIWCYSGIYWIRYAARWCCVYRIYKRDAETDRCAHRRRICGSKERPDPDLSRKLQSADHVLKGWGICRYVAEISDRFGGQCLENGPE